LTSEENMSVATISAPNQTRLKILAGLLRLERFTIADLCAHSGLTPSQVYPRLSELQDSKILESKSTVPPGEKGPRHCPAKSYQLNPDPIVRSQLENELSSFLPEFEAPENNRHLKKGQEMLTALSADLLSVSLRSLQDSDLKQLHEGMKKRFEIARLELKRARWESEVDFSEGGHEDHPISAAIRLSQTLEDNFQRGVEAEENRRKQTAARFRWASILSTALSAAIPDPVTTVVGAATGFSAITVAKVVSELVRTALEKRQADLDVSFLRPYYSSLELDLRDVQSASKLLAVLAKHAISYGDRPDEPLAYIQKLLAATESKNNHLLFDAAVLALLASQPSRARESWMSYALNKGGFHAKDIEAPVIARIPAARWSAKVFEETANAISTNCNAAVLAISETPFERGEEFEIAPLVYNPLPDEKGRIYISVADALAGHHRLYVKTTEAERPVILGVSSVAFADLFQSRVNQEDAWKLATEVDPGERIVKVDFFRSATAAGRRQAEKMLKSELSAELVG
jgi:hypothetical protein